MSDEQQFVDAATMTVLAHMKRASELSPCTDTELMRMATGAKPYLTQNGIDLALALYHERTGQHENGCDICDMEHMASLVAEYPEANTSDSRIAHYPVE